MDDAGGTSPLDALIDRIRTAFTNGRLGEAVMLLDEADHLDLDDHERLQFARVRAVTLSRAGDHRGAVEALAGVPEGWIAHGDALGAATATSMAAYAHNMLGDLEEALDLAAVSLSLLDDAATNAGDPALVRTRAATVRNTLGLLFLDLEAVELAIASFREALDLARDDDPILAGIVRANLASAYLRTALRHRTGDGVIVDADEELEHAERLSRTLLASDVGARRHVEAASILAAVLLNSGREGEAAEVLEVHAHLEPIVDDQRALVDWNLLWSRAHRARGRYDDALVRAERAIDLAHDAGDRISVSMARRERSRIREACGDLPGALADLRDADDGARELRTGRFEALVEQLVRRARLERETHRLGAERSRLVRALGTDALTGLGNRRRLDEAMELAARRTDRRLAVLMIDVDRFKDVNDDLGHEFGDRVLREVAATIAASARESDVTCRPGGDEFVMLLDDADADTATAVADRLRTAIAGLRWPDDRASVTVSIGMSAGVSADVDDLVRAADAALLDAKRSGRDRLHAS